MINHKFCQNCLKLLLLFGNHEKKTTQHCENRRQILTHCKNFLMQASSSQKVQSRVKDNSFWKLCQEVIFRGLLWPRGFRQWDYKHRVVASLQAEQMKFRIPVPARIQLLRVFLIGKRLSLFCNFRYPLVLKSNIGWVYSTRLYYRVKRGRSLEKS